MHTLTTEDLLSLWERCASLHGIDRSLQVLACALPERDPDELARLPLGSRDALLLAVRRSTLGDRVDAQDVCPACGEQVEVELKCSALANAGGPPPLEWSLEREGFRLTLRPLDSFDAAAAAQCETVAAARATLLARSVLTAERAGEKVEVECLPEEVVSTAAASIATHDSGSELMLEFLCPRCDHAWRSVLDVASFVWTELSARAQRLVLDVHALARAYGWHESDILAMGETRRAAYLALVHA